MRIICRFIKNNFTSTFNTYCSGTGNDAEKVRKTVLGEHWMHIGIRQLRKMPMFWGFRDRIGNMSTCSTKQHHLMRSTVHHVKKWFNANRRIAFGIVPPHVKTIIPQNCWMLVNVIQRELHRWHDTPSNIRVLHMLTVREKSSYVNIWSTSRTLSLTTDKVSEEKDDGNFEYCIHRVR